MSGAAIVDIRTTFGATFVGLLVSTTLFGLTLAQTWMYFWNYHNRDPKALRIFIAFISALDVLHTISSAYMNYWYLVLNFGNVENLDVSMWAFHLQIAISTVISSSVQLFYARRVYIVSQRIVCPILIVVSVAIAFSFGIFYTVREIVVRLLSDFHSLTWITCVALSAAALADILIAASMCWYLYNKRTGTDSMLTTLMAYSINSGVLTSILGVAVTVSFAVSQASLICLAIFFVLSKCYVNSLLAMLNSRDYVRDRSTTDNPENAISLSSIRIDPLSRSKPGQPGGVTVTVHKSAKSDFGREKTDLDEEPAYEIRKSV
ncbi:hypothetical protein V8E53_014874 [Lactarius tabidus]